MLNWTEYGGNWLLLPPRPIAIVHFLGGAFVAAAPQVTYRLLLEALAQAGYGVIATPFINTFDHEAIAEEVCRKFSTTLGQLQRNGTLAPDLPIYGIGHSMGCKVHVLIGSTFEVERAGNILMAFNNYPAKRSIPFLDQMIPSLNPLIKQISPDIDLDVEFSPSPEQTLQLVDAYYGVERNLLVKFRSDTIDQTKSLAQVLERRFPGRVNIARLNGNHLTPVAQDVQWQASREFSPIDAIGQWMKQEFYRDIGVLKEEVLNWMNPRPLIDLKPLR